MSSVEVEIVKVTQAAAGLANVTAAVALDEEGMILASSGRFEEAHASIAFSIFCTAEQLLATEATAVTSARVTIETSERTVQLARSKPGEASSDAKTSDNYVALLQFRV